MLIKNEIVQVSVKCPDHYASVIDHNNYLGCCNFIPVRNSLSTRKCPIRIQPRSGGKQYNNTYMSITLTQGHLEPPAMMAKTVIIICLFVTIHTRKSGHSEIEFRVRYNFIYRRVKTWMVEGEICLTYKRHSAVQGSKCSARSTPIH